MRGLLLHPQHAFHRARTATGSAAVVVTGAAVRRAGALRARPRSLRLAAASSNSDGDSDAANRARSRHGNQFEAKTRRRGRPAWMRSPYDSPLRDGNRDRLIGLLTERAAKTLMVYLMETNANVYSWLVNFYKENPIPKIGSWDEVSGEAFLRKLLSMPIEEAKYNTGRDSLFDNVRACGVDPRSIAQRIMDIRSQLAEEFIQELQAIAEENALLLRETLQTSLSTNVNSSELPAAHAKLKPLAPSSNDASKPATPSSSNGSSNNRSKYKQQQPNRPKVSTPPQSWRRYRPPGTPDNNIPPPAFAGMDGSAASSGDSTGDKAAAVAALNAAFKASGPLPADASGSHPELQGAGGTGADAAASSGAADSADAAGGAGDVQLDMQEVIAQLKRSLDADVAQLTTWEPVDAPGSTSSSSSGDVESAGTAVAAEEQQQPQLTEAAGAEQQLAEEAEEAGMVTVQEALATAEATAAVEVLEAAAADALEPVEATPELEEAVAVVTAAVEAAAAAQESWQRPATDGGDAADAVESSELPPAVAIAEEVSAASREVADISSINASRQPPLPKGWGPRLGVGFSQVPMRNNIVSVRQLTSKATPASTVAAADVGVQQQ